MARRIVYLAAVVLIVASAAGVYWVRRGHSSLRTEAPEAEPTAGTGSARLLLNEILFQPIDGEFQWVELVNAGSEPVTIDGGELENHAGGKFALPAQLTLPPGGVLLVRFDGQTGADTAIVHASPTTFLARDGSVRLTNSQGQLDQIAWGDSQPSPASLSRGGYYDELTSGTSLGRVPGLVASDPLEWIPYSPQQSTPGRPNPQPGVEILLPMDGAIVTADAGELTWYAVAGAARYRVQLAADRSFTSLLFDQTVSEPPVKTPTLAMGSYVWRVQAIAPDGTTAEYSTPSTLTVRPTERQAALGLRSLIDWLLPTVRAQSPPNINDQLPTALEVPLIRQHKDTRMLLLETRHETDRHAWDVDHQQLHVSDPADNMNCAPASVAMLTAYYGGRLSQDRINYEVFHADVTGPQGDLNWGRPYNRDRLSKALAFALGVPAMIDPPDAWTDPLLSQALLAARRDAKMLPAIVCKNRHCVVLAGFGGDPTALLILNDPGSRGTYLAPVSFMRGATVFVIGRANEDNTGPSTTPVRVRAVSDEPEVSQDYDGDGMVDFDEIRRFKTKPNLKDTDRDEIPDKEDVRASVHDRRYGFAYRGRGRDFDGDGKPMEHDDDADNGGCFDGWEDTNKNGKYDERAGETDNFSKDDDPCVKGSYKMVVDTVNRGNGPAGVITSQIHHGGTFSLRHQPDGKLRGTGTFSFTTQTDQGVPPTGCLSKIISPQPTSWTVTLEGNSRSLPDGSREITMKSIPSQGPLHPFHWINECPPGASGSDLMPTLQWFGFSAKLVNGKFEQRIDTPLAPQVTGTQYTELRLEEPGPGK